MDQRRPIAARSSGWAHRLARRLAMAGVSPDAVSAASLAFALAAAGCLLLASSQPSLALVAAVLIPLRLLANMLDGMVAVEFGRGGPLGPLWNEVPDRVADVAVLAAAGTAAAWLGAGPAAVHVGWLAAAAALGTAYVRELGRALGTAADFGGPFAKPGRMWAIVAGALLTAAEPLWDGNGEALFAAVAIVAVGTLLTAALRLRRLARALRRRPPPA